MSEAIEDSGFVLAVHIFGGSARSVGVLSGRFRWGRSFT